MSKSSFQNRIIEATKLDSNLYEEFEADKGALWPAMTVVILSSIAGWFYGLAYIRTGSILAPAILHAMVDGWWVYFFNPN